MMYREKNGLTQIEEHGNLSSSDYIEVKYFDTAYNTFISTHEDCIISIADGYEGEKYLIISGYRDCTQQELVNKKASEALQEQNKAQLELAQFTLLKKKHPEWFVGEQ